jgi:hypothetical protein
MIGAIILRNPPVGWKPPGWVAAAASAKVTASRHEYAPGEVVRIPAGTVPPCRWEANTSMLSVWKQGRRLTREEAASAAACPWGS